MPIETIGRAMEMVGADACCLHLNYLQEAVQPEGDVRAAGALGVIAEAALKYPVVVKETGAESRLRQSFVLLRLVFRPLMSVDYRAPHGRQLNTIGPSQEVIHRRLPWVSYSGIGVSQLQHVLRARLLEFQFWQLGACVTASTCFVLSCLVPKQVALHAACSELLIPLSRRSFWS